MARGFEAEIGPLMECLCIGDTAAAGGVFMGLGLRGVRGIVAAAGLGTWEEALSKDLMSVFTVGVGSEEVDDLRLRPIPCLRAAKSLSTAFM